MPDWSLLAFQVKNNNSTTTQYSPRDFVCKFSFYSVQQLFKHHFTLLCTYLEIFGSVNHLEAYSTIQRFDL